MNQSLASAHFSSKAIQVTIKKCEREDGQFMVEKGRHQGCAQLQRPLRET
ncbi:MAG: hypothetical protein KKB91_00920 [Proteobacteria bacterium]|nr:hypothetical protein [Pseudomonadota bacterium]MBU4326293.1 hypothetical protein [Pseudomonadota bacterium]